MAIPYNRKGLSSVYLTGRNRGKAFFGGVRFVDGMEKGAGEIKC